MLSGSSSMFFTFVVMDKVKAIQTLINEGQIKNLADLYERVPRKSIAEALGMNPTAFTNRRANLAGKFKLEEIKVLAEKMDVDFNSLLSVFTASL